MQCVIRRRAHVTSESAALAMNGKLFFFSLSLSFVIISLVAVCAKSRRQGRSAGTCRTKARATSRRAPAAEAPRGPAVHPATNATRSARLPPPTSFTSSRRSPGRPERATARISRPLRNLLLN